MVSGDVITRIEQGIKALDPASFQRLCDAYLIKAYGTAFVSHGLSPGTEKTTTGTPDTYFRTADDKYIFVEYTTKDKGLFNKIKEDIEKCLDVCKTGIHHEDIVEIIYCHTSSNIKPNQDKELKEICASVGIQLTIIGINKLAADLYPSQPIILHDYLNISIDTEQIQSPKDFVSKYNSMKMVAPIDTDFILREQEVDKIQQAYHDVDVVILKGSAGVGKTRIAIHYINNYASDMKQLCISNNALSIFKDLKLHMSDPGKYFAVIDDANQLSDLKHIIDFTRKEREGYEVKILITVRDYAVEKVAKEIREVAVYEIVNIERFTDDEIKDLVRGLGIQNSKFLNKIARIAEGNARLAILAGKLAISTGSLNSLNDATQLYDAYYDSYLDENFLKENKVLLVVAGIIAFLGTVHLERLDNVIPILESYNLDKDSFVEKTHELHDMELVDLCYDKIVRLPDQSISNFLLKYVYFDIRLVTLSEMIKLCFMNHRERVIYSVNTLVNMFQNKALHDFIEQEIRKLWKTLEQENSKDFFDFVKVFYSVNMTETLVLLRDKINRVERVELDVNDIDTQEGKNFRKISDDIIKILTGFSGSEDLPTAIDLLFQYYMKRPDLYMEFYHGIESNLGISAECQDVGCTNQVILIEKFIEHSDGWENDLITILFIEIARVFLQVQFSPVEPGRNREITIYTVPLSLSEGVKSYRELIWESLLVISKNKRYANRVRNLIYSYGKLISDETKDVMLYDFGYIKSIMETSYSSDKLENCIVAGRIVEFFVHIDESCEKHFVGYFEREDYLLYTILKGPNRFKTKMGFEDRKRLKRQLMEEYLFDAKSQGILGLIDLYCDIGLDEIERNRWDLTSGLNMAFDVISVKKDEYVSGVKHYLNKGAEFNGDSLQLVKKLFIHLNDREVYQIVNSVDGLRRNDWLYAYYHELPMRYINKAVLEELYVFLNGEAENGLRRNPYRDISFLEKYNFVDEKALTTGCEIIFSMVNDSPEMVEMYFSSLFSDGANLEFDLIQKFEKHLELLSAIYISIISNHRGFIDYDGKFLAEIYLAYPAILESYVESLIEERSGYFLDDASRNRFFLRLDNSGEILSQIMDSLIKDERFWNYKLAQYLKSILQSSDNNPELSEKQDTLIRNCIQSYSDDTIKMSSLFEVISDFTEERKISYWQLFFKYNKSYDDFKELPLRPSSWGYSGSAVPLYDKWITFLEQLRPCFVGLDWIDHKKRIEDEIGYLKKDIEEERIRNILMG